MAEHSGPAMEADFARRSSPAPAPSPAPAVIPVRGKGVREAADHLSHALKEQGHGEDVEDCFRAPNSSTRTTFQQPGFPQIGLRIRQTAAASQFGITALPEIVREKYASSAESAASVGGLWRSASQPSTSEEQQPVVCLCGMFSDLNRAWCTVDNAIYVWRPHPEADPDVVQYEGQEQAISAVALAVVKPGVFWEAIQYVLVICTSVEVTLVGVVVQSRGGRASMIHDGANDSISLQPLPLYSVATDAVMMSSINTTSDGRIFMGGEDGNLYELLYSASDNWRSKRCSLICHSSRVVDVFIPSFFRGSPCPIEQVVVDQERGVLFTRTRASGVQVYDLGPKCKDKPRKVAEITDIVDAAKKAGPHGLGRQLFARDARGASLQGSGTKATDLVHIAVMERSVSENLQLVGIMGDGRRLFMSTTHSYSTGYARGSKAVPRPSEIYVKYVQKAPDRPPYSNHRGPLGSGSPHRQHTERLAVEYAFYKEGMYLLSCEAEDQGHTQLLLTSRDFTLAANLGGANDLVELATMEMVRGHVCAISEMEPPRVLKQAMQVQGDLYGSFSDMLHAPMLPPRRFGLVSTAGTLVVEKLRPVDLLQSLLEGGNREHIRNFFQSYGMMESACMCLALATSIARSNTPDADFWSNELQNAMGLESSDITAVMEVLAKPPIVVEEARKVFSDPDFTARPIQEDEVQDRDMNGQSSFDMGGPREPKIRFSGRYEGFCLLAARLVRPVWSFGLFSVASKSGRVDVKLSLNVKSIRLLEERMHSLVRYMHEFTQPGNAFGGEPRGYVSEYTRRTRQKIELAAAKEQESISSLCALLQRSYESMSMLRMLHDRTGGNLNMIVSRLQGEAKNFFSTKDGSEVKKGSLSDLVVLDAGEDILRSLISAFMSYKMDMSSGAVHLKEISHELEATCPTLFQADDRVFYDARMALRNARTASGLDRTQLIQSALQMLLQVPLVVNIHAVFNELIDLGAYEGAVDLVVRAAAMRDPSNIALQNDSRSDDYVKLREECYILVVEVLSHLKTSAMTTVGLTNSPLSKSNEASASHNAKSTYDRILSHALASQDVCLHKYVYSQLMSMGANAQNDLVKQNPAYFEEFLRMQAGISAGATPIHLTIKSLPALPLKAAEALNVLGRLYVHRHMFSQAAYLQLLLAERGNGSEEDEAFVTLEMRQQHLLDALRFAKSSAQRQVSVSSPGAGDMAEGSLLDTVQCKIEIISLQIRLVEQISAQGNRIANELLQAGRTSGVQDSSVERLLEMINRGLQQNLDALLQAEVGHSTFLSVHETFVPLMSAYMHCTSNVFNLRATFFSLEELYNDFGRPEQMWSLCLEMLHLAQYADMQSLKDHWDMCLYAAVHGTVEGQSLGVACDVVRDLGQKFYPNDVSFPIEHIVQRLEEVAAGVWPDDQEGGSASAEYDLIPKVLLDVCGASERLRFVYDSLIERHTTTDVLRLQYLKSMTVVLQRAHVENQKTTANNRFAREAGLLLELCSKYKLKALALNLNADRDEERNDVLMKLEAILTA